MYAKAAIELIVKDAAARFVGLKPLAIEHKLRNRPLADMAQHLGRGSRIGLNVDFGIGDAVSVEIALGFAAIAAPWSGVHEYLHGSYSSRKLRFQESYSARYDDRMTAEEIKALLKLEPHPVEGGYFRRTYTSDLTIQAPRGSNHVTRAAGSAIYYLLEPGTFSEMHVLASDELFHFYLGDPVEMLQLWPDGRSETIVLGPDLAAGQHVQLLVPAGVWQGTRLIGNGKVALLGCSVVPGFDFADYTSGSYAELSAKWPADAERIKTLTRR
jgi:predicted cupin superfamily sugar epimerase